VTARARRAITTPPRMTPMDDATLLAELGRTLWGTTWKGPTAEAVRRQKGTVSNWARGRNAGTSWRGEQIAGRSAPYSNAGPEAPCYTPTLPGRRRSDKTP
jgi:hypothetical protein